MRSPLDVRSTPPRTRGASARRGSGLTSGDVTLDDELPADVLETDNGRLPTWRDGPLVAGVGVGLALVRIEDNSQHRPGGSLVDPTGADKLLGLRGRDAGAVSVPMVLDPYGERTWTERERAWSAWRELNMRRAQSHEGAHLRSRLCSERAPCIRHNDKGRVSSTESQMESDVAAGPEAGERHGSDGSCDGRQPVSDRSQKVHARLCVRRGL
jgi:hypothetical protein